MKVMLVVGGFPTEDNPQSGTFNQVAAEQIGRYVDLTVVHLRWWKPGRKFKTVKRRGDYGYICLPIPSVPHWSRSWKKQHFLIATNWIRGFLRRELFKTQVVHSVSADLGIIFTKVNQKHNFRHVCQMIGTDVETELNTHREKPWIQGWESALDFATFNSQALRNRFLEYYPKTKLANAVVYRGVNLEDFKPTNKTGINFNLLFLGGLAPYKIGEGRNLKGGIDLIEAWEKFNRDNPDTKVQLYFAGVDTDRDSFETISNKPPKPNLTLLGRLSREEVKIHLENCHAVIIPSRQDGLPNVALEAQASGLPVIGSHVGGIPECVRHDETGILFKPGNITEMCQAIKRLSSDHVLYEALRSKTRKHVAANFDSSKFGYNYQEIYKRTCVD